ncbi:MAG: hypothetical protein K2N87_15505 [Eubacterium sp.]|nr:hypothetical protein [Eubacterium sp.]
MDKVSGSMEALSAMQLTADMEGLDAECKAVFCSKEVLAVILQEIVEEYQGYSRKEVMDFIEGSSIGQKEVSNGRTNTQLYGEQAEFVQLNEKVSYFDILFKAKNPRLSNEFVAVNLHVDLEPQKSYRPGYPVEKRGIYYLARRISSQLTLAADTTDYRGLEKCYSIWICRDDVPKKERYSISFYEFRNTHNIGQCMPMREDYDLMTLVIIRLGQKDYNGKEGDDGYAFMRFLNAVMYPHKEDFIKIISEYIDFSENEELWQEVSKMSGLGQSILKEGREEGIQALILDHIEENIPRERSILKLQKYFEMTKEKAEQYYEEFAAGAIKNIRSVNKKA